MDVLIGVRIIWGSPTLKALGPAESNHASEVIPETPSLELLL